MMCVLDFFLVSSCGEINHPLKPVPVIYFEVPEPPTASSCISTYQSVITFVSRHVSFHIAIRMSQVKLSKSSWVSSAVITEISHVLFFFFSKVIYKVLDPAIHVKDPYSLDIQGQEMLTRVREYRLGVTNLFEPESSCVPYNAHNKLS